jgi:UDP-N-acetylglucosamine transferase subunit ALG13
MKTLLVASEGGHLTELQLLAKHLNVGERAWVTFESPQSRSALAQEEVYFAPFAGTRDLIGAAQAAMWARTFLRSQQFGTVMSTGASIAVAVLPLAARMGADCLYFESATRTSGPSLTGRLLQPFRSIKLYTQYDRWANRRWKYHSCIFDVFSPLPLSEPVHPQRIVVSLGLHRGFNFRRAVERLVQIIPPEANVVWQVGDTDTTGLDIEAHESLPSHELLSAMSESDVVITHAGCGSTVSALMAGRRPVVLPRRKQFGEHVDDHQTELAAELSRRQLAVSREVDALAWTDVIQAASWRVEQPDTQSLIFRPKQKGQR